MGAVRRVAEKLPGVQSVEIDLGAQKVRWWGGGAGAPANVRAVFWRCRFALPCMLLPLRCGQLHAVAVTSRPLPPAHCAPPRTARPTRRRPQVVVKGSNLDPAAVKEGVAKSGKATELWQ